MNKGSSAGLSDPQSGHRGALRGLMMHVPMLLSRLIDYAARYHGATEVIARNVDGSIARSDWARVRAGAARLANAMRAMGMDKGSRIASLAWNTHDHLELYYAVLGLGIPLHTLNPRLTPDDLRYMIEQVEDDVCFFDAANVDLARQLIPLVPGVRHWIYMGEGWPDRPEDFPGLVRKQDIAATAADDIQWPDFDENRAATICFTSGTTGRPKGVVYSHRSITLSSMNMSMADMYATCRPGEKTCVLPVAAMFHANAWMMPFSAPMNGQKLVLPGRTLDAQSVLDLVLSERVTLAGAVPTIWQDIIREMDRRGLESTSLHTALVAGTALPPSLHDAMLARGITPRQSWGMTEVPGAARAAPPQGSSLLEVETQRSLSLERQGRVGFQAQIRVVDENGVVLPHDGKTAGQLQVSGPTVVSRYLGEVEGKARSWLETGDIACIFPDSTFRIVDRAKDVIKSGGEWISSPQLEAAAISHPAIKAAAAIAIAHPRWQERPMLICVVEPGMQVDDDALREHMSAFVAKWWLPEEIRYVDELPLTPTGKVNKAALRERYA